ncbi:MAG: alpha/beta hydrolase [Peptococcaceae bacterium]|jgi:pimeloyl-ACP methyl ester carboxylesterase|nr:alpha/beta hydrolase [Peptococcaceae bacterium]
MPYIEISGERYFYLDSGPAGAPRQVLFLHGSGGTAGHWSNQLALAGPGQRVLAVDLPGHGRSGGHPVDRIAGYREFVRLFAASLSLPSLYLGGHSMGGAVVLDYALNYPGETAGLILIGTGARLRVAPAILDAFGAGRTPAELVDLLYGPGTAPLLRDKALREMETVDPRTWYVDFSACNAFDIMAELPRITAGTLVLVGSEDRLTPPKYARYLEEHMRRATVVTVEGAGHMVMVEEPGAVNGALASFLAAD